MAPEAERDKEVSPNGGDKPWGRARALPFYPTSPEHPWTKPCCSQLVPAVTSALAAGALFSSQPFSAG